MQIEQKLGLYRVFLKLYEYHRDLLDEILQLENGTNNYLAGIVPRYVQGVVQGEQVYLVTNIINGKTQVLQQNQRVWTIGRDRHLAMPISDKRLSRRHAAIQYIEKEGFYLVDFNSTNGSFINGEPMYQRRLLKDGDRLRLSSLAFSFFSCQDTQTLEDVSSDLLAELNNKVVASTTEKEQILSLSEKEDIAVIDGLEETEHFLKEFSSALLSTALLESPLNPTHQSEILDSFFSKQNKITGDRH